MLSDDEWGKLIRDAADRRPGSVKALEYRREPFATFAAPPLLACSDGHEYWVKFLSTRDGCSPVQRMPQAGGMVTDHVVGSLARILAPDAVPKTKLVHIARELIEAEFRLETACEGQAHGSRNASTNCSGRLSFTHESYTRLSMNRSRVADLAVLYGLALANDHQVIYQMGGDPIVFSVDHGHFLPGGPCWSAASLSGAGAGALDPIVVGECELTAAELDEPLDRLESLVANDIADCVAAPPEEWFFPDSDRIALARYLWLRRDAILQARA